MLRYASLPLTIGMAVAPAAYISAADVGGGLTIGGYVDSVLTIADGDDAINPEGDATIDFSSFFQLETEWSVDEFVTGRAEISFDDDGFDEDNFEEAHVVWAVTEQVSIIAGKFENWLGWEGADAPELYRVNGAYSTSGGSISEDNNDPIGLYGINTTGVGVIAVPHDQVELALFIVNAIYNDENRDNDSISFGGYIDVSDESLGNVQLDWMYGVEENEGEDVFGLDLWGELTAFQEEHGPLLAADFNYTDYDTDSAMAIMAMGNMALPTELPMSSP